MLTLAAIPFLLIFFLDTISAIVDLVHLKRMPKHLSSRKRIKLIKKQAMANMKQQALDKQAERQEDEAMDPDAEITSINSSRKKRVAQSHDVISLKPLLEKADRNPLLD